MPEIVVKHPANNSYAVFDPKKNTLKWSGDVQSATTFAGQPEASAAFAAACSALASAAQAKTDKAAAAGKTVKAYGSYLDQQGHRRYGDYERPANFSDYAPVWLQDYLAKDFEPDYVTRASRDDLMGVFDIYFIKSQRGWLGCPTTRSSYSRYTWNKAFHQAATFLSKADAVRAAAEAGAGRDAFAVVKSSCAFSGVAFSERGRDADSCPDQEAMAIKCACEARDIEADILKAAGLRMEQYLQAAEPGAAAPAKPKPRSI